MTLGNDRAVKTGQWYANEILMGVDINFVGQSTYENLVDQLSVQHITALESGKNLVLGGLNLEHDNLLTADLETGLAISPKGTYFDGDAWGFVASPGSCFLAMVPKDQSVAFDSGGANNRIDTVEIRPIEILYNSVSRDFKDPLTQQVTGSLTNTRKEYGYEFAVRKGDDSSALAIEQSDFTFLDSYAAFAGKYCLFSTAFDDYYIWWDVDDGNADPAISGRTGIEINLASATHTTATLVATKTETDLIAANIQGISVSRTTVVLSIDTTTYGDYTDATIGDVLGSDLSLVVTDGNGPAEETAGWIKIAEVAVGNGASAITQEDIVNYESSDLWNMNAADTILTVSPFISTLLRDRDEKEARQTLGVDWDWTSPLEVGSPLASSTATAVATLTSPSLFDIHIDDYLFAAIDPTANTLQAYVVNGKTIVAKGSAFSVTIGSDTQLTGLNRSDVALFDSTTSELRLYRFNGSTWSLIGSGLVITGATTEAGIVGLNGNTVAFQDRTLEKLRAYRHNGSTWALLGTEFTLPTMAGFETARIAMLSETDVAICDSDSDEIQAYRFDYSSGLWSTYGNAFAVGALGITMATGVNVCGLNSRDIVVPNKGVLRFEFPNWKKVGVWDISIGWSAPLNGTDVISIYSSNFQVFRNGFALSGMRSLRS